MSNQGLETPAALVAGVSGEPSNATQREGNPLRHRRNYLADLLPRDADKFGRLALSNVGGDPGKPQAPPNLAVNEIGFMFHRTTLNKP
jgi:hypothetical protein